MLWHPSKAVLEKKPEIVHGNTLTKVPYRGTEFDVVVANPPYGVSWKDTKPI